MGMELENRMISAEWLKSKCYEICDEYNTERLHIDRIIDEIDNAPDVEVVHGRWALIEEGQNTSVYQCSKCKRMVNVVCDRNLRERQLAKNYPYCNCGAKMDGVQK